MAEKKKKGNRKVSKKIKKEKVSVKKNIEETKQVKEIAPEGEIEVVEKEVMPEEGEIIKPEVAKEVILPVVEKELEEKLLAWKPATKLGKDVFTKKITNIDEILENGIKIKEPQIVDFLVPNLENELVMVGGRPGKGGGIQRTPIRITAKMHRSGRRLASSAFVIVGNRNGLVGIGKGRGTEGRIAIGKATQKAKLNLIKVPMGCGSWECVCGEPHSIPFLTEGKSGSVHVKLIPAPRGIGLAVDDETKKLLKLAGIHDVWIKTLGDTSTKYNLIKATFNALKNLHQYKTGE